MAPRLVDRELMELFRQERSPGHHVSTAIYNVMEFLYPDRFGKKEEGKGWNQDRLDLGNAVEHALCNALADAHPDRFARPGELTFDGITGTPDLWDVTDWCTCEIKLTWASAKRAADIEDPWFWRYWAQLKAYCYMAGQNMGRLIIYFINGDYSYDKDTSGPCGLMWEDEWSEDELAENWAMIKANLE